MSNVQANLTIIQVKGNKWYKRAGKNVGEAVDNTMQQRKRYLAASIRMSSFSRASICSTLALLIPLLNTKGHKQV